MSQREYLASSTSHSLTKTSGKKYFNNKYYASLHFTPPLPHTPPSNPLLHTTSLLPLPSYPSPSNPSPSYPSPSGLSPLPLRYSTRLRPGTEAFLEEMSRLYEMHVFTMGARDYANTITHRIDPQGK